MNIDHVSGFLTAFLFSSLIGKSITHLQGKVINGSPADVNDYPFFVSIEYDTNSTQTYVHICGGSLITTSHVLTAAHCALDYTRMRVRAGIDKVTNVLGTQTRNLKGLLTSPSFTYENKLPIDDIAFLILSQPFTLSSRIQLIPLPQQDAEPFSSFATVIGFGSTVTTDPFENSDILLTAEVSLASNEECLEIFEHYGLHPVEDKNICTKTVPPTRGICIGDSGGPLIQDGMVIGVVSWVEIPCEADDAHSVYTKVSNFTNWLTWHMKHNY